jgi:YVTN family beta-propeller protein
MNTLNSQMPSPASLAILRALLTGYVLAVWSFFPGAGQAQTVTATVTAGSIPAAVAANPVTNKIYVASGPITVIDGATNATTSLNSGGFPVAVAVNPVTNKIYFADQASTPGRVIVIDGTTNSVTTISDPNANDSVALALNPVTNKIYVANALSNNVTVIDANTNTTATVAAGSIPFAVAVNPVTNKIYVVNQASPVTVIDGATNATMSVATGGTDVAVNPVTNKIYVPNFNNPGTVTVIDGATHATTTVAAGHFPRFVAVNPVTNKIYVANQGDNITAGTVTVIDGVTNATATVNAGIGPSAIAVNSATNTIFVANANSSNVTVIDGATNAASTAADANASSPDGVAVNPVTNKIYVANVSSSNVTVIDGAVNFAATVSVGTNPFSVDVNPVTNRIYVANQNTGDVTVIDGATNTTAAVAAGTSPQAVAVNPVTNKIYVANLASDVTVIDGTTNATTSVTAGTGPDGIAVNPVTNKIYVANLNSANVTVIDGTTNATANIAAGANPVAVAVNPVTNTIYVANEGSIFTAASVTVIDGVTSASSSIDIGAVPSVLPGPFALAVNPLTNKIYVANNSGNNVIVIDGVTNAITKVPVGVNPFTLAVNPLTNKVYVANLGGNVTVIDGATNATTIIAAGSSPRAVTVNLATNKIYVTNQTGNDVTIIDGTTNSTTTLAVGIQPLAVAVNPFTNKAYLANYSSANVTVLSDEQAQPNPLTTAITPLPQNTTTSAAQQFQFAASDTAPAPVTNLYFQLDSLGGPWGHGTPVAPGSFTGEASGLSLGVHILYAFATDGEEATSVMRASSPVTGGITAYLFDEQGLPTSTSFTADVNPLTFGDTVTFAATVTTNPPSSAIPAGSVSFFDGGALLGNVALDTTGRAAFSTDLLTTGAHFITTVYVPSPTAGFAAGTEAALTETVNQAASSTALKSSPNPATLGQSVTFTATVSSSTTGTPTGMVQFFDGSVQIGTGTLNASGQAAFNTSSLTVGVHSITANYLGDTNFTGSTSLTAVSETVQAATSTTLTSSATTVTAGQQVTFTATVSSAVSGTPTGSVAFLDGTAQIGSSSLGANAQATFSTSSLAAGTHSITATYSGDANFAASASAMLLETVNAPLDFSIGVAAGGSTSATVKAGQTATYSLQLSLTGGQPTDQLTLTATCAQAPPKAVCTGPASPVTVTHSAPATLAISVSTTANGSAIPLGPSLWFRQPTNRFPIVWVFALLLAFLWMFACSHARTRRLRRPLASPAIAAAVLLFALAAAAITGCNGGSMSSPPPVANGTPAGAYTLVVTITANQPVGGATLSHTQQLVLTVQ